MSAAMVLTSAMPGMPILNGTGGSLAGLFRHIAPILGWSIEFDNDTDIIVVRPQSYSGGQALFYRIDDRAARGGLSPKTAEIRAYESMSDINTGSGLIGPVYIHKSYYANTAAQKYYLIGDQYGFYLVTNPLDPNSYQNAAWTPHYLGFLNKAMSDDIPVCVLFGSPDEQNFNYISLASIPSSSGFSTMKLHKNRAGTLNVSTAQVSGSGITPEGYALGTRHYKAGTNTAVLIGLPTYPYLGTALYSRPFVKDGSSGTISGYLPGLYSPHHNNDVAPNMSSAPATFSPVTIDGKQFVMGFHVCYGGYAYNNSYALYDISEGFRP